MDLNPLQPNMAIKTNLNLKTATTEQVKYLKKLSTERLIIWIIGRSKELKEIFSIEDIVIECWLINASKHSLRGYEQFPDSNNVKKRIYEMKGKKGLLKGSEMGGFSLTDISNSMFADLKELIKLKKVSNKPSYSIANRAISSIDEAPYKRLRKSPAYIKYIHSRVEEIVETDFLYFYGINWHSKISFIENRIKNIDAVVKSFAGKDPILKSVHQLLNKEFGYVKQKLLFHD